MLDSDDTNHTTDIGADVTVPAPDVPALADFAVTKTGEATVDTDVDGDTTFNLGSSSSRFHRTRRSPAPATLKGIP